MVSIVDLQFSVTANNGYIVKQLCIHDFCINKTESIILKPPHNVKFDYKARATNRWLKNNLHGLCHNCGDVEYSDLPEKLNNLKNKVIFVKGSEKCKFLSDKYDCNAIDLSLLYCPSISSLIAKYKSRVQRNKTLTYGEIIVLCINEWLKRK